MLFTVVEGEERNKSDAALKKDGKRKWGREGDQRPVLFDVSWRVEINFNWIDYKLPTEEQQYTVAGWNTVYDPWSTVASRKYHLSVSQLGRLAKRSDNELRGFRIHVFHVRASLVVCYECI